MLQAHSGRTAVPVAMIRWLYLVAAMIVLIVVVGGITRLTESGLSITQWQPISGIVPPLTDAQWQVEFAHYRRIPQYTAIHDGMTMTGFKHIFFWEYLHRLLGRVIGTVFALPLLWFALRRQIPRGYGFRLVALLALGGLQGAFGWLMVRSGLSDRIEVAPLWLAAHLMTALFTLAGLVWTALDLRALARNPYARPAALTGFGALAAVVLAVQLFYGALMAGLRAGLVTNEWPLMNGRIFPHEVLGTRPLGALMIDDPSLVHFIHRWWAWVLVAVLAVLARRAKAMGHRRASIAIHIALGLQILLGIAVVMSGVNIALAALHQLVGALLVVSVVWGIHASGRRRA
ncbi:COX15/CtaA family protein [Sphingomonas sp. GC_Shp_3]|uniref:COX15/CtaA family protein n=1 Tax=Sphingomonas sp. GC_Shp_3 TaxID=2937383 RepID=UPI0022699F74|nr:COX15/CtaA family protein [Sphingomonas sp. GC_Shp_3]